MAIDFNAWARQSDTAKIYLVEMEALRLADGETVPLYLATQDLALGDQFYLGCVVGLPRLTRQSNDTRNLSSIPSWGELEVLFEPEYRPDPGNAISWNELLSPAYTFSQRPLVIKIGGEGFALADFREIFRGYVEDISEHDIAKITFTVYDKTWLLEDRTIPGEAVGKFQNPPYGTLNLRNLLARIASGCLPRQNPNISEANKGRQLPAVLGYVKNYHPALVDDPGNKFILAAHVVHDVLKVRRNGIEFSFPPSLFTQRDLSPPEKDGLGSAYLTVAGPYTGPDYFRIWLLQIDSVAAGHERGQATFRLSYDGGATWVLTGQSTVRWEISEVVKTPGAEPPSSGEITVGGTYAGDGSQYYVVVITLAGPVGVAKFKWSDDSGANWSGEILTSAAPITLSHGVTVSFANLFDLNDQWDWHYNEIPILLADGVAIQFISGSGNDFELWDTFGWFLCSSLSVPYATDENSVSLEVEGLVTTDGTYISTAADLIREVLLTYAGWEAADLDEGSFAAFNIAFPYVMGLKLDSSTKIREVVDQLLAGLPAYYGVTLDGKFRLGKITEPTGVPAAVLSDPIETLGFKRQTLGVEVVSRVELKYDRNYAVESLNKGLKSFTEWAKDEWRLTEARDETVKDRYPLASRLEPIETCMVNREDAEAAAAQMLAIWKIERSPVTFTGKIEPFVWDLWSLVQLKTGLFGLDGALFWVSGLDEDFTASQADITLWK